MIATSVYSQIWNSMKLYYLYILVFSLYQFQLTKTASQCYTPSEVQETTPIIKRIGERIDLRCPSHPCTATAGNLYNFTKVNNSIGKLEFIHQGRSLDIIVTDYRDAGIYCCTPHCPSSSIEPCCINVQVQSEISFHMNETTHIHQHYTASCLITSNPMTNLYISTRGCPFDHTTLQIGEDTTKAIIEIYNITSECRKITCSTNWSQRSKTVDLFPPSWPTEPTETVTSPRIQLPTLPPHTSEANNTNSSLNTDIQRSTARPPTTALPSATKTHRNSIILIIIICIISLLFCL